MSPRVVLVGPMGAGKTTVAGLLGDAWDLPVRDTDTDIEAATGREISDIFVESGEDHFRDLEAAAVAAALAEHEGVLALGGGAVLRPETRELLAGLPLLLGNVRARIKALLDERTPVYESVSAHTVDTDGRSADEVAAEVRRLLG